MDVTEVFSSIVGVSKTGVPEILYEKGLHQNLSGNEVDHTNAFILPVKTMLCSELYCQKVLILIPFHVKQVDVPMALADARANQFEELCPRWTRPIVSRTQ